MSWKYLEIKGWIPPVYQEKALHAQEQEKNPLFSGLD